LFDYIQNTLKVREKEIKLNMYNHNNKIEILKNMRNIHYQIYSEEIDNLLFN
jgi:hypothetical protein